MDIRSLLTEQKIEALKLGGDIPPKPVCDFVTRAMDIVASALGLLVLAPLMLCIAAVVKLCDRGPALFGQERLGKDGAKFRMFKFRTMKPGAEFFGGKLRLVTNDPRVTPIGKILREFHLDELPQLINVLCGQMSLVGPRPTVPFHKDYYEDWEMARLAVRPGMTGLTQVSGGNRLSWDERIVIDVHYVRNRCLSLYFKCIYATFTQLYSKKDIYAKDGGVKGWTRGLPEWYEEEIAA